MNIDWHAWLASFAIDIRWLFCDVEMYSSNAITGDLMDIMEGIAFREEMIGSVNEFNFLAATGNLDSGLL